MDRFFKATEIQLSADTPIHEKTILETAESVESEDIHSSQGVMT